MAYSCKASPIGTGIYLWIYQPDPGSKKRPAKPPMKYKATIMFDKLAMPYDAEEWMQDIMKRHDDLDGNVKTCPVRDGDRMKTEDGEPKLQFAGKWVCRFASKFPPEMVDSQGEVLPKGIHILPGDKISVGYVENEQTTGTVPGLFLRMNAIQLVEKCSYAHRGANAFEKIEGGFSVSKWMEGHHDDEEYDAPDHTNF